MYAIVALFCLSGCGNNGSLMEISGTVTYDGKLIQAGTITMIPQGGDGPTAAGRIADGKYSMKVAPGKKQVRIEGFKILGQHHLRDNPDAPMVDIQEQIVPACYNTKTGLTCEITSGVLAYDLALEKSGIP
jgi:hypothetical protein